MRSDGPGGAPSRSPSTATASSSRTSKSSFRTVRLAGLLAWSRANSLSPTWFGDCCTEALGAGELASFVPLSAEAGAPPESADLLIVMGPVSQRAAPELRRTWERMQGPKWVIALGSCACSGGLYDNYATLPGIDQIVPVDVYVPGCPPRPEAFAAALRQLRHRIRERSTAR